VTLINRRQITPKDFVKHPGGAVELEPEGRKKIIAAYQTRKQDTLTHPMLGHETRLALLPLLQARVLARHLRGDLPVYYPFTVR
jgi:CRISPR-associated protein Cas1